MNELKEFCYCGESSLNKTHTTQKINFRLSKFDTENPVNINQ